MIDKANFKYFKSKKGSIEISISWLFMIIIGSFFLILAYNVIDKYQEIEEDKYNVKVKQTLRTIFNNVGITSGIEENSLTTTKNIFKNKEVEILCNDGLPILSIDEDFDGSNEFLRDYPAFMTYIEEGDIPNTYLAVENFKLPFKITNMIAIVSERNLIVFDEGSDITEKFLYKFRRGSYDKLNYVKKDFDSLDFDDFETEFEDNGLNSVVFVSDIGDNNLDNSFLEDLKYYSMFIEFDETNDKYGTLKFIDEDIDSSYKYYDVDGSMALQTMAIFSKPEVFECSYDLIFRKIEPVFSYYINKTSYYIDLADPLNKDLCPTIGNVFSKGNYEDFRDLLEDFSQTLINDNFNNITEVDSKIDDIIKKQSLSIEIYNCPLIY